MTKIIKLSRKVGFTLIELLIASAIFVIVLLTIYSAFQAGFLGQKNIEETINIYQGARQVLDRINLDLRNSFVYKDDSTEFSGSDNMLSFLSLVDSFREDKLTQEVAYVSYELEDEKLLRVSQRNLDVFDDEIEGSPEEMLSDVEINFKYGYMPSSDSEIEFKDAWAYPDEPGISEEELAREEGMLPQAVKVSLVARATIEYEFERTIYLPLAEQNNE